MESKIDQMSEEMAQRVMYKMMHRMVDALEKQSACPKDSTTDINSRNAGCKARSTVSREEFLSLSENELTEMGFCSGPDYYYSYDRPSLERADESILRKMGYTVAKNSELSEKQRQALLQNAIEHGLVSKGYIITFLESNIRINGRKESNSVAVYKWKRDLEFVRRLDDFRQEKR